MRAGLLSALSFNSMASCGNGHLLGEGFAPAYWSVLGVLAYLGMEGTDATASPGSLPLSPFNRG